ncbi:unnamed protein product [Linum trigynum]|uniref:Secreted protein n=1 Tax=Linum trigynum TaxID=586398 RepID=A0AAV2GNT1_9ROSI
MQMAECGRSGSLRTFIFLSYVAVHSPETFLYGDVADLSSSPAPQNLRPMTTTGRRKSFAIKMSAETPSPSQSLSHFITLPFHPSHPVFVVAANGVCLPVRDY